MEAWLYILGGATGVRALTNLGASCYLFVVRLGKEIHAYLIDAGMESTDSDGAVSAVSWLAPQDLEKLQTILDSVGVKKIDHVFLTHAHRDHAAAVALKKIRRHLTHDSRIICTRPTAAFLPRVLYDQFNVSNRRKENLPYDKDDIEETLDRVHAVKRPEILELVPGKISVLLWRNGHIRGSCSVIFIIKSGKTEHTFMFSGDYATHAQLTTDGAPLPPDDIRISHLLSIDCTNCAEDVAKGTDEKTFWKREIIRMADDAHNTNKAGGWFLTSAFALDRAPTFARKLADLGLRVYLDGPSARKLWDIMESEDGFWCMGDRSVNANSEEIEILNAVGSALDSNRKVGAIVAPSGMGHGPVAQYMRELLPRENAMYGASGYLAPGTNGYKALRAERGSTILLEVTDKKFEEVRVNARCEQYRATGHSLRKSLVRRIGEILRNSRSQKPFVGLCHGSTPALDWVQAQLPEFHTFRQDRPEDRCIRLL
ncbi:MAG: MBL fold metallo-hydrolase [Candidatus Sungbacteria bacterium]|nr:MBL fold metallo-hydrolase [Candidatus Sungbacteria bacterium]